MRSYSAILMLAFFAFSPYVCFAQEHSLEKIEALSRNEKIGTAEAVLKDFRDGKATARVIVNIRKPSAFSRSQNIKDMRVRQTLEKSIKMGQDKVLDAMNPGQVRMTNMFKYIFGFSAEVTLQGLQELIANVDVLSIEEDKILHTNLAQGIPLMNATTPRSSYNGSGLSVAICDTGIDYTHPRLGGGGFPNTKVIGGYDCGDDDNDPMDGNGHGTACAGVAAGDLGTVGDYIGGVAYNARLYAVKISYGSGGSAWSSDMIEGWEWCITHQNDDASNPIMVISTSFGGGRYFNTCDSASIAMTTAAANAVSAGMTLFVSSGNDGYCDSMGWPACITHVISVGAVYDANFTASSIGWCVSSNSCATKIATGGCSTGWYSPEVPNSDSVIVYSNTASFLSVLAPSNWATTTKRGGSYYNTAYGFGGTSAACPYAAGAAACLQSASKTLSGSFLTPASVKTKLVDTGDSITDGKVSITKPRVNLSAAVATLTSCPECPADGVITNATYVSGTTCSCTNATSITLGSNVTVESGAIVTFTAPTVNLQPGFHAENGASVTINQ